MITTDGLVAWLQGLGLAGVKFGVGPTMPEKPDRYAAVTKGIGRTEIEGLVDRIPFVVRLRGVPFNTAMAEVDQAQLRLLIERHPYPFEIEGHGLINVWTSGPPTPVPGTPDSGNRYESVATYLHQVSTDI